VETESPKKPTPEKSKGKGSIDQYARYSGLAFQMIAAILIGLWLGMKTDQWLNLKYPVFTAIFILLFIFASLYLLIRSLPKS
jgi:F0F1-type ATP synthase assembly protein I